MGGIGILSYRQRGISSWGMTGSSPFSLPLSCFLCPCFLISSSLPSFKMMTVCSSCANWCPQDISRGLELITQCIIYKTIIFLHVVNNGSEVTPHSNPPNLMRFSQWCYGVTGVSRHELGHLPVAFFSGKVGGRGRLEPFPVHLFIWFNLERTLLVLGDAWTLGSCVDEKIDALYQRLIKYILLPFPMWGRTSLCGLCLNSAWPHCRLGWSWYWT